MSERTDSHLTSMNSASRNPDQGAGLHAPKELGFSSKVLWWLRFIFIVQLARLRFVAILAASRRAQHWCWQKMELRFDARFGVRTWDWIGFCDFVYCEPSSALGLSRVLHGLGVPHEQYGFVDLGSGKGRALLLASEFPFKSVTGVEVSEAAHRAAQENVRAYRSGTQRCSNFELVCADARTYRLPPEPWVVYIFNSFPRDVLCDVVAGMESSLRSSPRHLVVIYCNPRHRDVLDGAPFLREKPSGDDFWAIYEHDSEHCA